MSHTTATLRTWMTMAEAAALLGRSVRTLERYIELGQYQVTYAEDGRRMVDMTSAATTPQTALADDVRTAGEDARKQAAVLSHAIERITAIHESQVVTLQQDIQLVRAELADAHVAAKRTSAKANRLGWAFGLAAVVVAGLGATLTHTLLDAEKQGATLRQVSDKLTHQVALTNEAKALAVAAKASEDATRQAVMSHTMNTPPLWWLMARAEVPKP